jgi:hypothetical protein
MRDLELSGVCGGSLVSGLHCKSCRMMMNDSKKCQLVFALNIVKASSDCLVTCAVLAPPLEHIQFERQVFQYCSLKAASALRVCPCFETAADII